MIVGTALVEIKPDQKALQKGLDLAQNRVTKAATRIEKSLTKISFGKLAKGSAKAMTKITKGAKAAVKAINGVGKAVGGAAKKLALVGAGGALAAGFTGKKFIDSVVDVGSTFEMLGVQLTTLQGSSKKAEKSLDWIAKFTAQTPYELDQVANSFVKLQAYGLDGTKWMKLLGDTASSMGKPIQQSVEAVADAMTFQFERLKEFGVKVEQQGDKAQFNWNENGKAMSMTVDKTTNGIEKAFRRVFKRFEGGMESMSKTWTGITSNLSDQWTMFKKKIADAGIFEYMKAGAQNLLDKVLELEKSGKLDEWAKRISDEFIKASEHVKQFGADTWEWMKVKGLPLFEEYKDKITDIYDHMEIWLRFNEDWIKQRWWTFVNTTNIAITDTIEGVKSLYEGFRDLMKGTGDVDFVGWAKEVEKAFKVVKKELNFWGPALYEIGKAITTSIAGISMLINMIVELSTRKATVDLGVKMSPRVGFTEGMKKATNMVGNFNNMINDMSQGPTIDLSGLYLKQLERVMNFTQLHAARSKETSAYSWVGQQQARNALAGARAGLDFITGIMGEQGYFSRGPTTRTTGVGSQGTLQMAGAPINVELNYQPTFSTASETDVRQMAETLGPAIERLANRNGGSLRARIGG